MTKKKLLPNITLATKVTITRILGVPVFILMLIYYFESLKQGEPVQAYRTSALILFIVIAATDALDGYLARSRNEITHLGRMLDPLADKLLILTALLLLTRPGTPAFQPQFPIAVTLLVISRDVILAVGAIIVRHHSGSVFIQPRLLGKLATVLLMGCIIWPLAGLSVLPFLVLSWISGICIFISGLLYLYDGIQQLVIEEPE